MGGDRNEEARQRLAIDILFKEYDTLRTEILARVRTRFELLGFITAVAAFVASKDTVTGISRLIVIGIAIIIAGIVWLRFGVLLLRCSQRVADLEKEINKIAGCELLKWESRLTSWTRFHQ